MAEANHRIANNLTLVAGWLRLQSVEVTKSGRELSADAAGLLLDEACARIDTVSRLHRLLAGVGHGSSVDLQRYLLDVAQAAIGSMTAPGATTLIQAPGDACEIDAARALSVGFIVGEAVTNAVKYAHPARVSGCVELTCHRRPDGAILVLIGDDGVGLPEGFNPRSGGSLGLRMMRMLADQLGASLIFESADIGLSVRLLVPADQTPGAA